MSTAGPKRSARQKRSAGDAQLDEPTLVRDSNDQRETRSKTVKRTKIVREPAPTHNAGTLVPSTAEDEGVSPPYGPSLALLYFVTMGDLDTSAETESIAVSLIDLTLQREILHQGLSGMLQPAACFLVASLLTRRQNLVEDIANAVTGFGITYEKLVKGYDLLWQWRDNIVGVAGEFAQNVYELPALDLFLAQSVSQQDPPADEISYEAWDTYEEGGEEEAGA